MIKLKDLKGLSGCQIELMEDSVGRYFVKKTSSSISYNKRLELQVIKQKAFKNDIIKTPVIFETGYNQQGYYYCLMEYIHGVTFAEYLNLYPFKDGLQIFDILLQLVFNGIKSSEQNVSNLIIEKIDDLQSKNTGQEVLLEYMKKKAPGNIPLSFVHGDLTFENILISHDKQIYFIDFLDSFLDSPYIDLGKLNQELSLRWSLRHQKNSTSLLIKYQKLHKIFSDYCILKGVNNDLLNFFSMLTILRILPYTTNPVEIDLIEINLKKWQQNLL